MGRGFLDGADRKSPTTTRSKWSASSLARDPFENDLEATDHRHGSIDRLVESGSAPNLPNGIHTAGRGELSLEHGSIRAKTPEKTSRLREDLLDLQTPCPRIRSFGRPPGGHIARPIGEPKMGCRRKRRSIDSCPHVANHGLGGRGPQVDREIPPIGCRWPAIPPGDGPPRTPDRLRSRRRGPLRTPRPRRTPARIRGRGDPPRAWPRSRPRRGRGPPGSVRPPA